MPAGDGGATTSTTTADPSTTIANTGTATTVGTSVGTSDPPNPTSLTGLDTTTIDPDSGDSDPSSDSMTFIQDPEVSCGYCASCSVWDQDCPKGEKCMPWANDGGNSWNSTRCSPIEQDPDQIRVRARSREVSHGSHA